MSSSGARRCLEEDHSGETAGATQQHATTPCLFLPSARRVVRSAGKAWAAAATADRLSRSSLFSPPPLPLLKQCSVRPSVRPSRCADREGEAEVSE